MNENKSAGSAGAAVPPGLAEMMGRRFVASKDYILRTIAGESVLIPIGSGEGSLNGMISANETFAYLWELFREGRTIEEAAAMAGGEYEDKDGQMTEDICAFVADCYRFGLIEEVQG